MLEWVDNFNNWTAFPGTFTLSNGHTINTGRLVTATGVSGSFSQVALSGNQSTLVVNARVNFSGTLDGVVLSFWDGSTCQCSLRIKANNKLQFYRGSTTSNAIGSEGATTIVLDTAVTFYDLEVKVVFGSSGSIEARLNGGTEIASTTANTISTANSYANNFSVERISSGGTFTVRYDHLIIMNGTGSNMNDFIGIVNVNTHTPSGAGNYSQFSPTPAVANYDNINDTAPDGDSAYNASSTVGHMDSFIIPDLPANTDQVLGTMLWVNAKRDDAATRGFKPLLRIGSTDYLGAEKFLNLNYSFYGEPFSVSPATSTQFTISEINNLEIGYKVTT